MPVLVTMSDFFFGLAGLALLVVGAAGVVMRGDRPGQPRWMLAGIGMILLGLSMWVEWVALARPGALGWLVPVQVALEVAAWTLLSLFGLTCLAASSPWFAARYSWLRYLIAIPVLAVALVAVEGIDALQVIVRHVLGLLATALAVAGLVVWSRRRAAERFALAPLIFAALLLVVGMFVGVPRANLWPAAWLNTEAVTAALTISPALLQAIGAILLAGAVVARVASIRRREAERSAESVPPSRMPGWLVPALLLVIGAGFAATLLTGERWETSTRLELMRETSTAGIGFRGPIEHVVGREVVSVVDPAYIDLKQRLMAVSTINQSIGVLWVARMIDGQVEFVADSEPPESTGYSPPGQIYREASGAIRQAFTDGAVPTVVGPIDDRGGSWFSTVYQVIGPGAALPPTVLGMDVPAASWFAGRRSAQAGGVGMTILLLVLVLGFGSATYRARELEAGVAASEHRYRGLVEGSPACVLMLDSTGRVVTLNEAGCLILGVDMEEAVGQRFLEMWPADSQPEVLAAIEKVMMGERGEFEAAYVGPNGRNTTLFVVLNPVRRGPLAARRYVGFALDVTKRRQAEEELRLTQHAVDQAATGVLLVDTSGRFRYANVSVARLCGYSQEQLAAMKVTDIDPLYGAEQIAAVLASVRENRRHTMESEFVRSDGERIPVQITLSLFSFEGQELIYVFVQDLRERKRAEEERRMLEEQVRHAQKLESLGVLAGGIAHDFNNLLVSILGHTELALLEVDRGSPAVAGLKQIEAAAQNAAALTNQMLAYSGRARFQVRPVELSTLVEEIAKLLDVSVPKKVRLVRELATGLSPVRVDVAQIQQVVLNLITNAAEAIGEEEGTIHLRTGSIAIDRALPTAAMLPEQVGPGTYVYVEVQDDGCGMDEETKQRIFDPFFSTKFTGRGLGLAAVLGIMRGHHGAIRVDSVAGGGTTVRVLFPAAAEDVEAASLEAAAVKVATVEAAIQEAATQVHDDWAAGVERHMTGTVLVVDDERSVRDVCRRVLEHAGFTVLLATDGLEGLEMYRTSREDIGAVVLDLTMPRMDGAEALKEILAVDPSARVVIASGYSEDELASHFHDVGAVGFVQKPFRRATLIESVVHAMAGGPSGATLQPTASVD